MNKDVVAMYQMFLVPVSLLFTALGAARTEPLKAMLSALGFAIGLVWICTVAPPWTPYTFLPVVFAVASLISTLIHGITSVAQQKPVKQWLLGHLNGVERPTTP